jgi:hypothetical protein
MKQIGKPSNSRLMLIPPVILSIGLLIKSLTTTKVQPINNIDKPYGSWRQDKRSPKMDIDTNIFKEDSITK